MSNNLLWNWTYTFIFHNYYKISTEKTETETEKKNFSPFGNIVKNSDDFISNWVTCTETTKKILLHEIILILPFAYTLVQPGIMNNNIPTINI